MRKGLCLIALVLWTLPAWAGERPKVYWGDEKWTLGWSQNQNGGLFEEYVLPGESVQNWSELVTIQFFPGLQDKTNPDIYEASIKRGLVQVCPDIQWESIEQQDGSRLWGWSIQNCPGQPDQSELAQLVRTRMGFHVVHYAIKKSPMPADKRRLWEGRLGAVKIYHE